MSDIWLNTDYAWCVRQSWSRNGRDFWPSDLQNTGFRLGVGHSTETTGFPGYNGGAAAPHFTIDLVSGEVRQHVPLNWGSRCLAISAGGITDRTVNITGVVQVEVIGAVTPGYPARYGHYDLPGKFPTDTKAQYHLARLVRAIHDATGIPMEVSGYAHYQAYPASYGARNARRLSSAEYRDAMGWIGHQHAPANDHGDGLYGRVVNGKAVDFEKALELARTMGTAPTEPPKYEDGPNPDNNFGFPETHVLEFQGWLNVLHRIGAIDLAAPLKEDGVLTTKTMAGVRSLQATLGFPKAEWDGLPGPKTTTRTEALMTTIEKNQAEILELLRPLSYNMRRIDLSVDDRATLGTPLETISPAGLMKLSAIRAAQTRKLLIAATEEERAHVTAEADRAIAELTAEEAV
ncbi:hypothetical protein ACI3EY_16540 [Ornithinimicrobium sp. LYQ92]|uniref:hypothetical protein n=1 Tax=Serinicoccus sp. LYQ92 TaxID=3378798 RepID=UPI0038537FA4